MKPNRYYVFYFNEDGDPPRLDIFDSPDALAEHLKEYEISEFIDVDAPEVPDFSRDTGHLIIRGRGVMPKPKAVVQSWDVE